MSDVLAEWMAGAKARNEEWGVQPGWLTACWKEMGLIPEDADSACLLVDSKGVGSVYWRYDGEDSNWVYVGSTE